MIKVQIPAGFFFESDYDLQIINPLREKIISLLVSEVDRLSGLDFSSKEVF